MEDPSAMAEKIYPKLYKKGITMSKQTINNKLETFKVYKTGDYDKFKFVASNRQVSPAHVREIMNEIQRINLTSENPIKVTRSHEIMEGQHTFEACKELGVPVYYMYTKMSKTDIGQFNSVQKSWSYKNVLNHFCVEGYHDYKILAGFLKRHPYPITTLIILLTGEHTKTVMNEFKRGNFKVSQSIESVEELLSKITQFKEYSDKIYRHRTFVLSYIDTLTHPDFNHDVFVHKVSLVPSRFIKQETQKEYLRMVEDIYNYRNNNPIRLF